MRAYLQHGFGVENFGFGQGRRPFQRAVAESVLGQPVNPRIHLFVEFRGQLGLHIHGAGDFSDQLAVQQPPAQPIGQQAPHDAAAARELARDGDHANHEFTVTPLHPSGAGCQPRLPACAAVGYRRSYAGRSVWRWYWRNQSSSAPSPKPQPTPAAMGGSVPGREGSSGKFAGSSTSRFSPPL